MRNLITIFLRLLPLRDKTCLWDRRGFRAPSVHRHPLCRPPERKEGADRGGGANDSATRSTKVWVALEWVAEDRRGGPGDHKKTKEDIPDITLFFVVDGVVLPIEYFLKKENLLPTTSQEANTTFVIDNVREQPEDPRPPALLESASALLPTLLSSPLIKKPSSPGLGSLYWSFNCASLYNK